MFVFMEGNNQNRKYGSHACQNSLLESRQKFMWILSNPTYRLGKLFCIHWMHIFNCCNYFYILQKLMLNISSPKISFSDRLFTKATKNESPPAENPSDRQRLSFLNPFWPQVRYSSLFNCYKSKFRKISSLFCCSNVI